MQAPTQRKAPHAQHEFAQKAERLLRRPEVEARTGLGRSTIYDWMKRGEFPLPVKLGGKLVAWRESVIDAYIEARETQGEE